jgi:hypothetical protein
MIASQLSSVGRSLTSHSLKPLFVLAAVFAEIDFAVGANLSVGPAEVVYTKSQRKSGGGSNWPDGSMGAIANGNGTFDFYGPNSSNSVKTTGTLLDPGASKQSVKITGAPKKAFSYLAGGPVYEDPYSGARLMVYHAEDGGKGKSFYAMLGLAISTDPEHREFRDLGLIVRPNLPSGNAEIGGGSFTVVDGYMNVYYKDWLANGLTSELAVARASMVDIMNNALMGQGTAFQKYYNGSWSQPGLGGLSSPLEAPNPANAWVAVSYNTHIGEYVMVSSQWMPDGGDLYMATSPDGVNFGPRQAVAVDPGEQFYPSIFGTGPDPRITGDSFYVYYTDSKKGGWSRPDDAQLFRRQITVNGPAALNTANTPGYTADWVSVSNYQDDFQTGTPAQGWKYAWDPKGKLGKQSAYAPLLWSDSAQAYNTTGGATVVPNPKTHKEDYLSLTADGGFPGQSKYVPMAGYTIQQDDGAGFYRLTDSSIQKTNGTLLTKEDGLQVFVYVNDTLIGSSTQVSTNGLLANFDRNLGALNVGDTVWVMVDPLKTQIDDAFTSFDFSLQRLVYSAGQGLAVGAQLLQTYAVPEPSTALLCLMGIAACCSRRRR